MHGALTTLVKSCVLRDILNGIVPQRCSTDGDIPVNLQKDEQVVWAFPNSNSKIGYDGSTWAVLRVSAFAL